MKLEGSYRIAAPCAEVWEALLNPEILRRIIPGCEKLEPTGEHRYAATFRAGAGQIKGNFTGEVAISDLDAPNGYTLRSRMKSAVGFVEGQGRIALAAADAGDAETTINYSGEVKIGGLLASIAGRLVEAAAKKNMEDMFSNLNRVLSTSAASRS
ncbi:MAG TPA: carbon monoxide dehydrogenase subunit G [Terriglobales bacterium]|nr:carbon monoxide dehydrogenase subunit G [Terriglobales bacterium]